MAAWDCNDQLYDRAEALGQTREVEGESVTEGFYPEWAQPEHVARELRAVLEPLGQIAAMFKDAA